MSVQEQEVDVGVGEEPAAAIAAERDQGEAFGSGGIGRDDLLPEAEGEAVDQGGALLQGAAPVTAGGELPLNTRGFLAVEVP